MALWSLRHSRRKMLPAGRDQAVNAAVARRLTQFLRSADLWGRSSVKTKEGTRNKNRESANKCRKDARAVLAAKTVTVAKLQL